MVMCSSKPCPPVYSSRIDFSNKAFSSGTVLFVGHLFSCLVLFVDSLSFCLVLFVDHLSFHLVLFVGIQCFCIVLFVDPVSFCLVLQEGLREHNMKSKLVETVMVDQLSRSVHKEDRYQYAEVAENVQVEAGIYAELEYQCHWRRMVQSGTSRLRWDARALTSCPI